MFWLVILKNTSTNPFTGNLTHKIPSLPARVPTPRSKNVVITNISGVVGVFNTQPSNPAIDVFVGNAEVQMTLPGCGAFSARFDTDLPSQLPPHTISVSLTYELDADNAPTDYIQFWAGAFDLN